MLDFNIIGKFFCNNCKRDRERDVNENKIALTNLILTGSCWKGYKKSSKFCCSTNCI